MDFACSAPYVNVDMHPNEEGAHLDAIYFSPHKFLGGPGTPGVLCFHKSLYKNTIPDNPGGGTVEFTNPWGIHAYVANIEAREDGGTPGFLQTMKAALCMKLKNEMGVENILKEKKELSEIVWNTFDTIENIYVLANDHRDRLGIFSFYIDDLHYNLGVKMLNDRFGIQTRGGCSCAGTYGHYLLNIANDTSETIWNEVIAGNCSNRPGWIRMSVHPTMTNSEVEFIMSSIKEVATNWKIWKEDYTMDMLTGAVQYKDALKDNYIKKAMDDCLNKSLIIA